MFNQGLVDLLNKNVVKLLKQLKVRVFTILIGVFIFIKIIIFKLERPRPLS